MDDYDYLSCFKKVPKTGVIYVLEKAVEMGYDSKDKSWANLGQGAPDTNGLSKKQINISITQENSEYAPVCGRMELRKKIAAYYNELFRKNSRSKYTYKNVCVAGGGRMALSRLVAALGNINLGHFIPDYTAYEELLSSFSNFVPIPILLKKENNYTISLEKIEEEILGKGLSALLLSNPCNPTGQYIKGDVLEQWLQLGRDYNCLMILDEFYSYYLYDQQTKKMQSAAQYCFDVNKDPLVVINGLSKNWKCPGWRMAWILAPEKVIEKVSSVGSFLDGGAVNALQEEACHMLDPSSAQKDLEDVQKEFTKKKDFVLKGLLDLGFKIDVKPSSTFYIWCDVSSLPGPLGDGEVFFNECLKEKVIVVPGVFFDVNPGKRRSRFHSRYKNFVRISFGPSLETLKVGLESLRRVIKKFNKEK